jgi:hypothetical protein
VRGEKFFARHMATEGHAGGGEDMAASLVSMPKVGTSMPTKKNEEHKKKVATYFAEVAGDSISFDDALLVDESMLNSWFQEANLPIKDRALLFRTIREYKNTFARQSTEAIEETHGLSPRVATKGHAGGGDEKLSGDSLEAKITKYFEDKAATLGIKFDKAMLFDESMLNSWFEEAKLPIKVRAELLEDLREFKDVTFAKQSTEAIEGELTTKLLFDALLFAVAFTVPTGVDRAEMQEAWMGDDALYNVSKTHLGSYDVILIVMTFLVTTSTGLALIVGFTIYSCIRYERPSSIVEANEFYVRFQVAFRFSYGFTYAAILLAPFSCFELHLIKSPNAAARVFFTYYGFVLYGGLVVFLTWSLRQARKSRAQLQKMRGKAIKEKYDQRDAEPRAPTFLPALQRSFTSLSSQVQQVLPKSPTKTPVKQTRVNSTERDDPHSA